MTDPGFLSNRQQTAFDRLRKSPYYSHYSVLAGLSCHPNHWQQARRRCTGSATPDQAQ